MEGTKDRGRDGEEPSIRQGPCLASCSRPGGILREGTPYLPKHAAWINSSHHRKTNCLPQTPFSFLLTSFISLTLPRFLTLSSPLFLFHPILFPFSGKEQTETYFEEQQHDEQDERYKWTAYERERDDSRGNSVPGPAPRQSDEQKSKQLTLDAAEILTRT